MNLHSPQVIETARERWRRVSPSPASYCAALLAIVAFLAAMPPAVAQSIFKADNTTALNDPASWQGGVVPGAGNVAVWDSTVTAANAVALSADLDWSGIEVLDPGGLVTITAGNTLSLGSGGIDLTAATADLAVEAGIALTADQSWRAAAGRTITLSGVISGASAIEIGAASLTTNTFLTTTAQPLFPNATLSELSATSGVMAGGFVGGSIPGLGYLLANDGSSANYWLQVLDGGYTKGLQIELAQSGYCSELADDFVDCAAVVRDVGLDAMRRQCMTCCTGQGNWQQTTRSLHRDGVNIAFCDGSVRFVSDWIETSGSFGSVCDRLICSADGLPLDWSQVER